MKKAMGSKSAKRMAIKKSLRSFVLGLSLVCFLTTSVAVPRAQAIFPVFDKSRSIDITTIYATRITGWGVALGIETSIIALIGTITATFIANMELLEKTMSTGSSMKLAGNSVIAEAKTRLTQAKADAGIEDSFLEIGQEVRARHIPPNHQQLCNAIVANKASVESEQFERGVKNLALSAIEMSYRTATSDGSGPQAAYNILVNRCTMKLCNPTDGCADDCVDTSTKGTDGRKLTDADLTSSTLDGGQVLELPTMSSTQQGNVSYQIPDPQNTEQKFWVAGLYYCINSAGTRPTPPSKDQYQKADNLTYRAQWDHCAAIQSALASACSELLAYYTRPNSSYSDLIADQKKTFEAVTSFEVTLPDSYAGGAKGMSPYQEAYANQAVCKSNRFYTAKSEGGSKRSDMMKTVDKCSESWTSWQELQDKRKLALVKATGALNKLPQCWQERP